MAIRAIIRLFLAAILGAVAFLVIWFIWNPTGNLTLFIAVLVTSSGVPAGVGGSEVAEAR